MYYTEALDILDRSQNTDRLRFLCSRLNRDEESRLGYRKSVVMMAKGQVPKYEPVISVDYNLPTDQRQPCCGG